MALQKRIPLRQSALSRCMTILLKQIIVINACATLSLLFRLHAENNRDGELSTVIKDITSMAENRDVPTERALHDIYWLLRKRLGNVEYEEGNNSFTQSGMKKWESLDSIE